MFAYFKIWTRMIFDKKKIRRLEKCSIWVLMGYISITADSASVNTKTLEAWHVCLCVSCRKLGEGDKLSTTGNLKGDTMTNQVHW